MRSILSRVRTVAIASAGALALAAPAADAAPRQEGLVNVNVSDVIVQAPVSVAANICDTAVNVLARAADTGGVRCTAEAGPDGVVAWGGGDSGRQEGLVNVNVSDLIVQLPINVAANVCDTTVNVLAEAPDLNGVRCDAAADPGDVIAWAPRR